MFGIPKLYAFIGIVVSTLAIVALLSWAITSYGARKYQAGVDATDAKWEEASNRLKLEAEASATRADDNAVKRLEVFEEQVAEEQERINEAIANNSSTFDILFGN